MKKRINTLAKGNRNQIKARDYLTSLGCYFYYSPPKTRYSKDMFGLFDFFMFSPAGVIFFVQVTSNSWHTELIEKIKHFTKDKTLGAIVMNCLDGGEIKCRYFIDGNEILKSMIVD